VRIYVVLTNNDLKVVRFVRAASQAAAIRAVIAEKYSAEVASAEDIVAASKAGTLDVLDASTPAAREAANGRAPTLSDEARPNSRMPT
jgi:hypothetical protein